MTASFLIGTNKKGFWREDDVNRFLHLKQDLGPSLPSCLEYLRIFDYDKQLLPQVIELIANKTSYTPSLKTFRLHKLKVGSAYVGHDQDSNNSGFTLLEARKFSSVCRAAYVQLSTSEVKSIKYCFNDQKIEVHLPFPYNDFEVWCEEHGCEIETGELAKFDWEA